MIEGDLLDKIDAVGRAARFSDRPFGGVQLIVSGDFLQLPPVRVAKFAFEAAAWGAVFGSNQFCLTKVFRQKDASFIQILNELRLGRASPATVAALGGTRELTADDGIEPTKLFAKNALSPRRYSADGSQPRRIFPR